MNPGDSGIDGGGGFGNGRAPVSTVVGSQA